MYGKKKIVVISVLTIEAYKNKNLISFTQDISQIGESLCDTLYT